MQSINAKLIAPLLAITGFRFSKDYRYGKTKFHALVYRIVSTPLANFHADKWIR